MDGEGLTVPSGFALAITDRHHAVSAVLRSLHAIASGAGNGKRLVGRIDFKVAAAHVAYPNIDRSSRELDLHHAVVKVEERKTCVLPHSNGRATQLQFCARVFVSPEFVAGG